MTITSLDDKAVEETNYKPHYLLYSSCLFYGPNPHFISLYKRVPYKLLLHLARYSRKYFLTLCFHIVDIYTERDKRVRLYTTTFLSHDGPAIISDYFHAPLSFNH